MPGPVATPVESVTVGGVGVGVSTVSSEHEVRAPASVSEAVSARRGRGLYIVCE